MDRTIKRLLASALAAVVLALGAPVARAQSSDRVLAPVNPNQVVALGGHHPAWAQPQADAGAVPAELRLEHLTLVLARSPEVQQAFEQLLQRQQDPTSSDYHRWLTPLEVGERFGVSLHDIAAISEWLQSQNLRVDSVSSGHVRINFSGTAAAVGGAFGSELHYFLANSKKRISITAPPLIPAALAPVIAGIHGLYSLEYHPMHQSRVGRFAANRVKPDLTFSPGVNFIVPADFAVIYDLNPVYAANITGKGQTIAIIGRSRVDNADIESFQSLFGLATKDPSLIIPPDGFDPGPPETVPPSSSAPSADQGEATLDVVRAGSTAPDASIDLVVSASTLTADGVAIAASYVVDTTPVPARIMSLSFSACENETSQQGVAFWDNVFSQAAAEGISVFVASGDSGAAGCEPSFQPPSNSQIVSTNALCSSSYATCVGGTEFADVTDPNQYWNANSLSLASALSYIPEGAWNEPANSLGTQAASSGGGVSAYIPTPPWQTGPGVPTNRLGRYTPDVAFSSSEHDSYFVCFAAGGGDCLNFFVEFYGTSVAAPAMAGIAALLNQQTGAAQGNLNPVLYKLAATPSNNVFHDVTIASSGVSNCTALTSSMCNNSTPSPFAPTGGLAGYLVGVGFDEVTGLGSLDVARFLANWSTVGVNAASTITTLTSKVNPAVVGSTLTFNASVVTTGPNPPTGTVTFLDGPTTLGTATLTPVGAATFATSSLSLGLHSIVAVYGGDANNPGSTSETLTETILASSAVPELTSLSPSSTYAGGGAFTLTVTGANFLPNSTVLWNGSSRATTYLTGGTQLQAAITASDIAATGSAGVTVKNPTPGGGTSNVENFQVLESISGTGGYLSMFQNSAALGNSLLYQSNGRIGLGTTSPQAALDVRGGAQALSYQFSGNAPAPGDATATIFNQANVGPTFSGLSFSVRTGAIPAPALIVDFNRNVGIAGSVGALAYTFTGNATAPTDATATIFNQAFVGPVFSGLSFRVRTGAPTPADALTVDQNQNVAIKGCLSNFGGSVLAGTCSSDARLKTNILPFAPVLDRLVKLQPVHFDWRTSEYPEYHFGSGRNSGLLAQEVEKVFPEMVTADARGFKMVNYSELPYLTLAAIRELKSENDSLRGQLAERQRELEELRRQVGGLGTRLARLERSPSHRAKKKPPRPRDASARRW